MSLKSEAEKLLHDDLAEKGFPPIAGYQFHPERKWAFDLSWPPVKLAVEIDGRGRHQRAQGERRDMQKQNAAVEMGWTVLRYGAASVKTAKRRARIVEQVKRVLCGVECPESAACVLEGE